MPSQFMSFGSYLDQYKGNSDLTRLEVMQANEDPTAQIKADLSSLEDVENRVGEDRAVRTASSLSERMSQNQAAQFERSTRGMDLSPRQKRAAGRRLGLSRSLNRASATGEIRRGFTDRSKSASSLGQGFADAFFSERLNTQTGLARSETGAEQRRLTDKANKKAATIGTIGQIAGTALAFFSSEDLKHDRGREKGLLDKLKKVRVNRWQYKGDDKTHVGPFAEEFNVAFGTDTDRPDMINVIDAIGVTLGAVKELNEKVEASA